jgi:DNA gyrase inhibitor GyrI
LPPRLSATFNIVYDDPNETPPDEFRFGLCAATVQADRRQRGWRHRAHHPGRTLCAAAARGFDDQLAARCCISTHWLPASGETPRDFPLFMQRVTFFPDVPTARRSPISIYRWRELTPAFRDLPSPSPFAQRLHGVSIAAETAFQLERCARVFARRDREQFAACLIVEACLEGHPTLSMARTAAPW